MVTGGFKGDRYEPLATNEVYDIHMSSLEVLSKVGVVIKDEKAKKLLDNAGAIIDDKKSIAYIPEHLVEEAIDRAPSTVTLCARDRENDLRLHDQRVYLGTGGAALYVLDMENGARRQALKQDVQDFAIVVNALDNVHFYMIPVYPSDVPAETADRHRYEIALRYSRKHVMGGVYTRQGALDVIKMAEAVAGGPEELARRPLISLITCAVSPLTWDDNYIQILIEAAEHSIPVSIPSEAMAGGTGPATLAGSLVLQNAETLSGIVIAELAKPGAPVLYGTVATIMDPRTGVYASGAIESALLNAAASQMAQYYEIPIYATAGLTDSKVIDVQAGYEKAMTTLLVALSGANYIHDAAGLIESALTVSYEQLVIDNDILGMVMRGVRGIVVNDESLAVEVIRAVGPGGHYLSQKHTLRHAMTEYFMPTLSDRSKRENWERLVPRDIQARAKESVKKILASQIPSPLPSHINETLKGIVLQADRRRLQSAPIIG